MINFACFVPHSPLLIPEIGKENIDKLKQTIDAYKVLEQELYAAKPDLVVVISSHANKRGGPVFTINQEPNLQLNFKDFGDLVTKMEIESDIGFGYQIKELCEHHCPIILTADKELDYGSAIPLYYLVQHLPKTKIVSIGYADLPLQDHFEFGQIIRKQINLSDKRVAVVASGDLSHRLHKDSPAGFSPQGQEYDEMILKNLANKNIQNLVNIDPALIKEAAPCGTRSLIILLGIIKDMSYEPIKLSYQAPFGIGYLTEQFKFS